MGRAHRDGLRKICGCKPASWTKCPHGWHFSFMWAGTHHRYSLDKLVLKKIRLKGDAETEANRIRAEVQAGTFTGRAVPKAPGDPTATMPVLPALTLGQLLENYRTGHLAVNRKASTKNDVSQIGRITGAVLTLPTGTPLAFGCWCVSDIKTATIEQFRNVRRAAGEVAANRNLALLRAAFGWAVRQELVESTPFKRGTETVVKLRRESRRSRRLEPGEGEALLAVCGSPLRAIVEAALETGCRRGELLSLQWSQVRLDARSEIFLPGPKTKTNRDRRIPLSGRLRAILEMRRHDPDGKDHPPEAYVFGSLATGEQAKSFKRAWYRAVLVSHGHKPVYAVRTVTAADGTVATIPTAVLSVESRATLKSINLHFHDLRREAGSRWLDGGIPLTMIRQWLGHSNISQTSTYLETQTVGQNDVMRQYEERRETLQKLANASGKSGHKRARTAVMRDKQASIGTGKHQIQ